jgi:hypothetical protein
MDGCIVEWMGLIVLPKRMLEWVDRKVSFDRVLREGHIWGAGLEFTASLLQYVILALKLPIFAIALSRTEGRLYLSRKATEHPRVALGYKMVSIFFQGLQS